MGLGLGAQPTHLEAIGLRPGLLEREASIEDGLHLQLGREDVERVGVARQHDARAHLGREQRHERECTLARVARLRERLLPRLAHLGACRQETQGGVPAASSPEAPVRARAYLGLPGLLTSPSQSATWGASIRPFDTVWRQGGRRCSLAARAPPARPRRQLPPSRQRAGRSRRECLAHRSMPGRNKRPGAARPQ